MQTQDIMQIFQANGVSIDADVSSIMKCWDIMHNCQREDLCDQFTLMWGSGQVEEKIKKKSEKLCVEVMIPYFLSKI